MAVPAAENGYLVVAPLMIAIPIFPVERCFTKTATSILSVTVEVSAQIEGFMR